MSSTSFIVGDAGGTSTSWRVVEGEKIKQIRSEGYNAHTHDLASLKENILRDLGDELKEERPVYLYAAGVGTQQQKSSLENELREYLGSPFHIESDLVGAARSLCGRDLGNVCILGTGSNACYYDGSKLSPVSASLGYVLGDEGSGAYLGKKLLVGICRVQLEKGLIEAFNEQYGLDYREIIRRVYQEPTPNQFLASFAHFLAKHKNHPEIYRLIYSAFEDFFHAFFFKDYEEKASHHFSGAIAFHFSDILRQVGSDLGYRIGNIVESPIAGLVLYHQNYG